MGAGSAGYFVSYQVAHSAGQVTSAYATVLGDEDRGVDYLVKANAVVGARLRAIEALVYREHYLTSRWPNREILMEVRKLEHD